MAVSINILVDSDLIGATEKTADKYKTEFEKEQAIGAITIDGVKYDSIQDYLDNVPSLVSGARMRLISDATEAEEIDPETNANVSTLTTEGVPIPTGFYYVGGTLNTGVVISDDADDLNKGDGHNVTLQGNQFVWVPVEQNQRIKIEIKVDEEITSIKIKDPKGEEITTDANGNEIVAGGTSLTTEIKPTINGTYTVMVNPTETTTGSNPPTITAKAQTTLEVHTLYAQDFTSNSSYTDTVTEAQKLSVNKYGGFYIARYEAGSEVPRKSSSATLTTVYSKKNLYPYNYISQTDAITKAGEMYSATSTPAITSVTSTLPNAAAWDRTLNWLIETNAVTKEEVTTDSTSWGNYKDSSFNFTGKYTTNDRNWPDDEGTNMTKPTYESSNSYYLLGTGVSDYTRRNNIYDLAGNCYEWTTEADSSGNVVVRGGNCNVTGGNGPASFRVYISATNTYTNVAFRPALYINQ